MAPEYDNGMEFCMIDLSTVPTQALANRIITVFLLSFLVFMGTARILGSERKERWFKRRTKYTLLNRRGIFGEYMNFGYPRQNISPSFLNYMAACKDITIRNGNDETCALSL